MIIELLNTQELGDKGQSFEITIQGYLVQINLIESKVTSDSSEYVALQDKLASLGEDAIVSEADIIASLARLNVGDSVTIKTTFETDLIIGDVLFNTRLDKKVEQANTEIDRLLEQLTASEDD
jgi:hypothetical protein